MTSSISYSNATATTSFSCPSECLVGLVPAFALWSPAPTLPAVITKQVVVDPNTNQTSVATYCNQTVLDEIYNPPRTDGYPLSTSYAFDDNCGLVVNFPGVYVRTNTTGEPRATVTLAEATGNFFQIGTGIDYATFTHSEGGTFCAWSYYSSSALNWPAPTPMAGPLYTGEIISATTITTTYTVTYPAYSADTRTGTTTYTATQLENLLWGLPQLTDYLPGIPQVSTCSSVVFHTDPNSLTPANVLTLPPSTKAVTKVPTTPTPTTPSTQSSLEPTPDTSPTPATSAPPPNTSSAQSPPISSPATTSAAPEPPTSNPPVSTSSAGSPEPVPSNRPETTAGQSDNPGTNDPGNTGIAPTTGAGQSENPVTNNPGNTGVAPTTGAGQSDNPVANDPSNTGIASTTGAGQTANPAANGPSDTNIAPTPSPGGDSDESSNTDVTFTPAVGGNTNAPTAASSVQAFTPDAANPTTQATTPLGSFIAAGLGGVTPTASDIPSFSAVSGNPSVVLVDGSLSVTAGGAAVTVSGEVLSVPPSGGGVVISPRPSGAPTAVVIDGTATISPGGAATTISNAVYSALPSGQGVQVVSDGVTSTVLTGGDVLATTLPGVIVSRPSGALSAAVIDGTATISPGGAATTISNAVYSALPSGQGVQVVSGGVTSTILTDGDVLATTLPGIVLSTPSGALSTAVIDGTATISSGGAATTISGTAYSVLPSGQGVQVVSGGVTRTVLTNGDALATTLSGVEISAFQQAAPAATTVPLSIASGFVLGGSTTLSVGGSAATISGAIYTLLPSNIVEVISGTSTAYVIDGSRTLSAGEQTTISGTVYTALPSGGGVVVVDATQTTTVAPLSPTPTQSVELYTGAAVKYAGGEGAVGRTAGLLGVGLVLIAGL